MRVVAAFRVACRSVSWIISVLPLCPARRPRPARGPPGGGESSHSELHGKDRLGRLLELHFETQALEFLHQNVEGFRRAGLGRVLALDDRLVDARPPAD